MTGVVVAESPQVSQTTNPESPTMSSLSLTTLQGTPLPSDSLEGKVVLFVNVASECGFTNQYEGMQSLYTEKQAEGLVIVGVPCNQFGSQEPGNSQAIANFCRLNYGVDFPLLEKQEINGPGRSELYRWLVGSDVGGDKDVRWNFEKFLVDRNGQVVDRFSSRVAPDNAKLTGAIDQALLTP